MTDSKPHILIVDDEEDVRNLLSKCLARQNWLISTASNNTDCLDKIRKDRPNLIILDIMMPGVDGYHTCHTIKSDETLKNIPIIILTAKTEGFQREKAEILGADAYVCKPCDLDDLIATIERLLNDPV